MTTDRIGWLTFWFLAAFGFVFGIVGFAHGSTPTLAERIIAVQPSLASKTEEPVDQSELASAIVAVPHVTREWAALLLTVASHESALSARIARGDCRPKECDHGAAWGLWQQHRNTLNAEIWGSGNLTVQTKEAARALRRAFYQCQRGPLRPDWVRRTISAYAGHSCEADWPGLDKRLATFERVRAKL